MPNIVSAQRFGVTPTSPRRSISTISPRSPSVNSKVNSHSHIKPVKNRNTYPSFDTRGTNGISSNNLSNLTILGSTAPTNRGTKSSIYSRGGAIQTQTSKKSFPLLQNDEKNYAVSTHMTEVAQRLTHTSLVSGQDEHASSKRFAASLPHRFSFVKSLNCIIKIEPLGEDELYVAPTFADNEVLHDPYEIASLKYSYYLSEDEDDDNDEYESEAEDESENQKENDENCAIECQQGNSTPTRATGVHLTNSVYEYYNFLSNNANISTTAPNSTPSSPETSPRPYSGRSNSSHSPPTTTPSYQPRATAVADEEAERRRAVYTRRRAYNIARERDEAAGRDKFWYTRSSNNDNQQNAWGLDEVAISEAMSYLNQSSRRSSYTSRDSSTTSTPSTSSRSATTHSASKTLPSTPSRTSSQSNRHITSNSTATYSSAREGIAKAATKAANAAIDARNARLKAQQMRVRLFEHWKRSGNEDEIVPFPPRDVFSCSAESGSAQTYTTDVQQQSEAAMDISNVKMSSSNINSLNSARISSGDSKKEKRESSISSPWKEKSLPLTFPYAALMQSQSR